jgi:predicted transcriptional regulator of viral defense system
MAKEYYRSALALAALELQHTPPMIATAESDSHEPKQEQSTTVRAETKRSVVDDEITEMGSFHGQGYELVYISAPMLAEILGVSTETARRRLSYFEEQGVLDHVIDGRPHYYRVKPEYTAVKDETVRTESEIISTTKRLLAAAEEE